MLIQGGDTSLTIAVDKTDAMLGSYGPQTEPYTKVVSVDMCRSLPVLTLQFASEESPSGMLARSGSYLVKSRIIDDDRKVWLDFEWGEFPRVGKMLDELTCAGFKLGKEW